MVINVCVGSACHLKGSYNIINKFEDLIKEYGLSNKVVVKAAFCLGQCTKAVSVKIDDGPVSSVNEDTIIEFFKTNVLKEA